MKQNSTLSISIPKPCHKDWDAMTPQERGRFCGSCQKLVIDFTQMSDEDLIDFFVTQKQRSCGRFRNDQLGRIMNASSPMPAPHGRLRCLTAAAVLSFIAVTASCQTLIKGKVVSSDSLYFQTMGEVAPISDSLTAPEADTGRVDVSPHLEPMRLEEEREITAGPPLIQITPVIRKRRHR